MSAKVNLTMRVQVDGKDRYAPVVIAANGRVKPDWVVIGDQELRYPEGHYYIDWTDNGRRKRQSVGKSAAQALTRKERKETELKAVEQGIALTPQDELDKRRKIATVAASYLEEIQMSKSKSTFNAYTTALEYFQESCTKVYMEDIDRMDMIRFAAFLRDHKDQAPRSVSNKFENMMTFLKAHGVTGLIRKGDWPKYVEEDVETYEKEDLDKFFSACSPTEFLWFQFFLMTGMREQEVIYCVWKNVKFTHKIVAMKWNPDFNWFPKRHKEREIPVPNKLITLLEKNKPTGLKGRALLFPTSTGLPKMDFLDCCKAVAKRAGLDPADWWLHKFRATFATWHLQAGVDLRTMQAWMGHTDLESTLRYLKPARSEQARDKVNATFA